MKSPAKTTPKFAVVKVDAKTSETLVVGRFVTTREVEMFLRKEVRRPDSDDNDRYFVRNIN